MTRIARSLSHRLARLRAPVLVVALGVAVGAQGPLDAGPPLEGRRAALTPADGALATAVHPAGGLASLLSSGESTRAARGGAPGASGAGSDGESRSDGRTGSPSTPLRYAASTGSPTAAARFARDALVRAGRLSSPATAPPASPF